jgi:hypothetical protein
VPAKYRIKLLDRVINICSSPVCDNDTHNSIKNVNTNSKKILITKGGIKNRLMPCEVIFARHQPA